MKLDSLRTLSEEKREAHYKKGQVIFNEFNSPDGIYAVADGSLKIYKEGKEGKEQILKFVGAGAVLGYRAIICDQPFGVSAAALEDTSLCFIPKATFQELLTLDIEFTQQMLQELSKDLGDSHGRVVGLTQKSVKERVSEALLNLKAFYGENTNNEFLTKKISRTHIAQLCGISLESAVRTLKALESEGVIVLVKKEICIKDVSRLAAYAGVEF
jgi:CRP/FNR family transcriptional regulator